MCGQGGCTSADGLGADVVYGHAACYEFTCTCMSVCVVNILDHLITNYYFDHSLVSEARHEARLVNKQARLPFVPVSASPTRIKVPVSRPKFGVFLGLGLEHTEMRKIENLF